MSFSPTQSKLAYEILQKYIPAKAVLYSLGLWEAYPFNFKVTRQRKSKLGDFCYRKGHPYVITINGTLNPYSFLITYLHEIAHLQVHKIYGKTVMPHGKEWKLAFRRLLYEVATIEIFPEPVFSALNSYMRNIKASSLGDATLAKALAGFDAHKSELPTLDDLIIGTRFAFHEKTFIKEKVRRTRVLCKEEESGRQYLILRHANVRPLS